MGNNALISKGLNVSEFYYSSQKYFNQLILLTEGIANLLMDKGWKITSWYKGRPIYVSHWSWVDNRSTLTKGYSTRFEKEENSNEKYGFSIWFFNSDPSGDQPWVPTAYFFRVSLETGKNFEDWHVDPKIAQVVRPTLLNPSIDFIFLQFSEPWPSQITGNGVDSMIRSINIVPFPLVSIENSEHLETITTKAVKALSEKEPNILRNDEEYLGLIGLQK